MWIVIADVETHNLEISTVNFWCVKIMQIILAKTLVGPLIESGIEKYRA